MIINSTHRFIFIHIPKTAGTSVTSILSQYTELRDLEVGGTEFGESIQPYYKKRFGVGKHSSAQDILRLLGQNTWDDYVSFTLVRNPFFRAISTFYFLKKWGGGSVKFNEKMARVDTFQEFIRSKIWNETNGPDDIFLPQAHWITSPQNPTLILVKHVGKVESLEECLPNIVKLIPTICENNIENIPKLNQSVEGSPQNLYFEELNSLSNSEVEIIINKYRVDFNLFNYPTINKFY